MNMSNNIISNISSLIADFDATANVTSSNGNVSSWTDKYASIIASAGSTQPKLTTNYINTYPAIDFGSASGSILVTNNASTTTTELTLFFVMKAYSRGGYNQFCTSRFGWGPGAIHLLLNGTQFQFAIYGSSTVFDFYTGTNPTLGSPFLLAITINTVAGCTITHRYNGTLGTIYSTSSSTTNMVANFEIGNWTLKEYGGDRTFNGGIGQFIHYNKILSTTEIQQVEGYLAWKWGLQTNLPNTHPYYSTSPTITAQTTNPTITNFTIPTKQYGAAAFTLTPPTSDSSGAFTYTSANTSVATIAGNTVTILSIGSTVITASQAATSTYNSGTITATLIVSKATPTITNFSIATKQFGDAPFTLTAPTSNSSGTFTYTSDNTSVATIAGNTVTVIGGGTTTITATQAETTNYTTATITATLTVGIDPICFLRGTRITCLNEDTGGDKEVEIETLRPGKFIKTYKHGYVPVNCIGYSMLPNPTNTDERIQDRLYKLTPRQYPTLTRDLIITGCHAILEDELTEEQTEKTLNILEDIYVTDDKYRLIAMIDERAEIYETEEEESEIWHLCLEHEDDKMNYGIYANGLLVESCCKCNLERVNLTVPPNPLP